MVNYWLCVVNQRNWSVVRRELVWGVPRRHRNKLASVRKGDVLIFYIKGSKIGGIFQVVSDPYVDETRIFDTTGFPETEKFPYRVKLKPVIVSKKLIDFRPLVGMMSFITNKRLWGLHLLGKAMIKISQKDFEILKQTLESGR